MEFIFPLEVVERRRRLGFHEREKISCFCYVEEEGENGKMRKRS